MVEPLYLKDKCVNYNKKYCTIGCRLCSKYLDSKGNTLLEKESKFLNPHLQCNGECHKCDDNIPSHGSVPNQCKRQQQKEADTKKVSPFSKGKFFYPDGTEVKPKEPTLTKHDIRYTLGWDDAMAEMEGKLTALLNKTHKWFMNETLDDWKDMFKELREAIVKLSGVKE